MLQFRLRMTTSIKAQRAGPSCAWKQLHPGGAVLGLLLVRCGCQGMGPERVCSCPGLSLHSPPPGYHDMVSIFTLWQDLFHHSVFEPANQLELPKLTAKINLFSVKLQVLGTLSQ